MPKPSKPPKQKSLLTFFGASSSGTRSDPPTSSPPQRRAQPTGKAKGKGKGKLPAKSSRALPAYRVSDGDEDLSEGGGSTSSDVGAIGFEPEVITVGSTSEDDDTAKSPRKPTATQRKTHKRRADSEEKSSAAAESDSDGPEHIGVPVIWKKSDSTTKGRKRRIVRDSDDDQDEPRPRRRKLIKGVRPPTPEEDDLLEEVDSNRILESRLRTRDKKSMYLENLERLKRRKMKQPGYESAESASSNEDNDQPFAGAKPHVDTDSEAGEQSEDENLSGFIEEDSVNAIAPELPAEFSMNTYQDLMHHFKIICQLFVHLAVQDHDDRQSFMEQSMKDQYFSIPLQIARRKLSGMKDSSVTSSVWRTSFKNALETYPDFATVQMDYADPGCDACHLGGRLSTILGRVSGDPYDRLTFEPITNDSSASDSDEDDDRQEVQKLKTEFHLGRFCARRTRVFHKFTHWEYALFKSLSQEVEDLKNRSTRRRVFVPVAYAGGVKPPEDLSDADGIMSWLDDRGIITSEWHKIKEMMDNATNLEVASKRGDDDD